MSHTIEKKAPKSDSFVQKEIFRLTTSIKNTLEQLAEWYFSITRGGATLRSASLAIGLFLLWATFAFFNIPEESATNLAGTLINLFWAFFSGPVIRRMLVFGLAYLLASRAAANYLDDIFELANPGMAAKFINQAAFSSWYTNTIVIRDGDVDPRHKNSPVYHIGGPGFVKVHLENAALFEKIDGTPHIIGPGSKVALEGFERLRHVYDLRDQTLDGLEVENRTKDGIPVVAKDIKVVFSVYRGAKGTTDHHTYAYTDNALQNLVYRQSNRPWTASAKSSIEGEIRRFIGDHTLSEFLANVSGKEINELQDKTDRTILDATGPRPRKKADAPDFVSRSEITRRLYESVHGTAEFAENRGYEVQWIGIGTWTTPRVILSKHLQAWEISVQNEMDTSPTALDKLRRASRREELLNLIQDVLNAFGTFISQRKPADEVKSELLLAYREKLRNAYEYLQSTDQNIPVELNTAIIYLTRLTAHWISR